MYEVTCRVISGLRLDGVPWPKINASNIPRQQGILSRSVDPYSAGAWHQPDSINRV